MPNIPILDSWKLPRDESNRAQSVFLIRPAQFGDNPETRASNPFQGSSAGKAIEIAGLARREIEDLAQALVGAGARAVVLEDEAWPCKPDAVYPNNWVSFHRGGTAVLYPMLSPLRRLEVRPELLGELRERHGVGLERVIDLSPLAEEGAYLEGTGSLVFDRVRGMAFACRSPRTTDRGLRAFSRATGIEVLAFRALDEEGTPYYHTNVMLGLGDRFALVALDAIVDPKERRSVRGALAQSGRQVICLSRNQVRHFGANVMEIATSTGTPVLALSRQAESALGADICARLSKLVRLLPVGFETIETIGGGSVRCALASLH